MADKVNLFIIQDQILIHNLSQNHILFQMNLDVIHLVLVRHLLRRHLHQQKSKKANTCFNLINPLSWFVQNNNAQTTPSLRSSSGADLKVKPMLD